MLLLSSCSDSCAPKAQPVPSVAAPDAQPPNVAAVDAGPPPPTTEQRVAQGETLWDIARAYGVSINEILAANDMRERDARRLRDGTLLRIPGEHREVTVETAQDRARKRAELPALKDGAYHHLQPGESLWTLSRTYDVPIEQLMQRNQLDDGALGQLRVGRAIIIPGAKAEQTVQKGNTKPARVGIHHELMPGETVWDLAHAFRVSVSEIMAANSLSASEVTLLRDGTRLFIPGIEEDTRPSKRKLAARERQVRRRLSARERRADRAAQRLGLGSRKVAGALLRGRVERRWIRAAGGPRLEGTLRWPVTKGWFVRGFGSGEGGYHLAMDIMGKIGWNVRAAARGIVGYSGNGVRGYGNIVMVIHPGGWVTMYAHNSVNFVRAGEQVQRGSILAEVGSTGISRGPHVHFELMHAGRNCDPAPLLRPAVRHRNGNHAQLPRVSWKDPKRRPKQIRCAPRRRHPRSRWVINEDPGHGGKPSP